MSQIYPTGIPACANPSPVIGSYPFDPESRRASSLPAQFSQRSRSFDFDAVQHNWGEVIFVNGQPRRRDALTAEFQISPVVTELRSVTEDLTHVIVPYSIGTSHFRAAVPAFDAEKDRWIQHMPEIQRLPGCTKTKANELIAFQIRNAERQVLHLYQRQGFVETPEGGINFGCVPEGCLLPPHLISDSVRRRTLLKPPADPTSLFASWLGLFQRHPVLIFLGLFRIASLMQHFLIEAGIKFTGVVFVRPCAEQSAIPVIHLMKTDDAGTPVTQLNAPIRQLKKTVSDVVDGVAILEDHSFLDERNVVDRQLRFLLHSKTVSCQAEVERNLIIVVADHAASFANQIAAEQTVTISLEGVSLETDCHEIDRIVHTIDGVVIRWLLAHANLARQNCQKRRLLVEERLGSIEIKEHALFCSLIAAETLLNTIFGDGLADEDQLNQLLNDIITESQSVQTCDSAICSEFALVLSNRFRDGTFKAIRKRNRLRIDPASFTAIVSGERLLVNQPMLEDCVPQMKTAHGTKGLLRALRQQGMLVMEDGNTNPTEVHDLTGKWRRLQLYDLPLDTLDMDVVQKLRNLDTAPFWLSHSELSANDCIPLLQDGNGHFAVRRICRQEQENMHTLVTGQSGTGKSYLLCQLMAFCQELWHHVVVFDFSDSFPQEAMQRNLPPKYVDRRVVFINLDDQSPADSICTASAFFSSPTASSWAQLFKAEDRIVVLRLDPDYQIHLLDSLLRALFRYQKKHPEIPLDVFADEIQNLDFSDGTAVCQLLKEGRKYNIAFYGATQDFYARSTVLGRAMGKAKTMIFLRPTQNSELQVAAELRLRKAEVEAFDAMERGDVIIKAPFYNKSAGCNQSVTLRGKVCPFTP